MNLQCSPHLKEYFPNYAPDRPTHYLRNITKVQTQLNARPPFGIFLTSKKVKHLMSSEAISFWMRKKPQ